MTLYVVVAAGAGFVAALVTALIAAYVQLLVRTAPVGRRLVEANAARESAEAELAMYAESVAAWQHYAQGIEDQLRDARDTINHLAGRHRLNGDPVLDPDDVTRVGAGREDDIT